MVSEILSGGPCWEIGFGSFEVDLRKVPQGHSMYKAALAVCLG